MKTVLVKSLTMAGGGKTYDLSSLSLTMSVGSVPTCTVGVITGYNLKTKTSMTFTDSGKETVYTIDIKVGDTTTTLFTGYIQSVGKSTAQNPIGGSGDTTTVTLLGLPVRLMKYGGSNFSYFSVNGTPTDANGGCINEVTGNRDVSDKTIIPETEPYEAGMLSVVKDVISQSYGLCVGEESAAAVYSDIEDLIKDNMNIRLSPDFKLGESANNLEVHLAALASDRYAGSNVLDVLFSFMSPEVLMLQLAPRMDYMEILPTIPWLKNPQITIDKSNMIAMESSVVLKNIRKKPDMVAVLLTDTQNSNTSGQNLPPQFGSTYPETSTKTSVDGGAIQVITMPEWLTELDTTYIGNAKDREAKMRLAVKAAMSKTTAQEEEDNTKKTAMAELVAKAYFGAVRNNDITTVLVVPWYQFDFLFSTGYVIEVTGVETVPEGGSGTMYGRLSATTLTIKGSPAGASCSMRLTLSNLRSKEQNEAYGMDKHPLYEYDDPLEVNILSNTSDDLVSIVSAEEAALDSPGSGVGPVDAGKVVGQSGITAAELAQAAESGGTTIGRAGNTGTNNQQSVTSTTGGSTGFNPGDIARYPPPRII